MCKRGIKVQIKITSLRQSENIGPYYKSELELKSNSSEILPVATLSVIPNVNRQNSNLRSLSLTYNAKKKGMNTVKVVIKWQNFARVRLQLKFAFITRPIIVVL